MKKEPIFRWISDESALLRNFLRDGRVRVNALYEKWFKNFRVYFFKFVDTYYNDKKLPLESQLNM